MNTPAQPRQNGNGMSTSAAFEADEQSMYDHQAPRPQDLASLDSVHLGPPNNFASQLITRSEASPVPAIQTESLPRIYDQAGVSAPDHGFTILKVAEMLASTHLANLSLEGKRAAILMALEANEVQINDIIEDAARRDVALNQYEAHQQKTFQEFKAWKQQQNQEIQAEIDLLIEARRSRIEANEKEVASEKARLEGWRTQKREEERRIRSASSHFVQPKVAEPPAVSAAPELGVAAPPDPLSPMAAARPKPPEPRIPENNVAGTNGNGPVNQAPTPAANNAAKKLSLWKR